MVNLFKYDLKVLKESEFEYIIGIDEAGRGPLAGPVVAASAVLNLNNIIEGINDSKKISPKKRKHFYDILINETIYYKIIQISEKDIDLINIRQATIKAMEKCVSKWGKLKKSLVLIDGDIKISNVPSKRQRCIIKGDSTSASIAAASILAKVYRDEIMVGYSHQYPNYGFDNHKGYGTREHIAAIKEHGLCPIHRESFCTKLI